jgi:hypothetical protein
MNDESFEDRLLTELKGYVDGRAGQSATGQAGRRATSKRRAPWRLASGGVGVAAAIAVAVVLANGSPNTSLTPDAAPTTPVAPIQVQNADFAIESEPATETVEITILDGSKKPDVNTLRRALAEAGVSAEVLTSVPTCQQLVNIPSAPTPIPSASVQTALDPVDHLNFVGAKGDLVYTVDASPARTRNTTVWVMFSSSLSTIVVERALDSSPRPNCVPDTRSS